VANETKVYSYQTLKDENVHTTQLSKIQRHADGSSTFEFCQMSSQPEEKIRFLIADYAF